MKQEKRLNELSDGQLSKEALKVEGVLKRKHPKLPDDRKKALEDYLGKLQSEQKSRIPEPKKAAPKKGKD